MMPLMPVAVMQIAGQTPLALSRELLASPTATAVLERHCGKPIRAEVDRKAHKAPTPAQRARLGVGPQERVVYRSVVLSCDGTPLSVAENWYVPARLTAEMNAALEAGDQPFGAVIRPLGPHRRPLEQARGHAVAPFVLRHRALVLDAQDRPLAEVVENYTGALLKPLAAYTKAR